MKRNGFGLLNIVFLMVILSALLTIAMKYVRIGTKQTEDFYLKEQAELFLNSSIELALLGIEGYDKSTNMGFLKNIKIYSKDKKFIANINVTKYFIYKKEHNITDSVRVPIESEKLSGMVLIEAEVKTNPNNPKISTPIRIVRRSLQRP